MSKGDELPTIGQLISNWLGVQLPTVPMPQTLKNFDKAVSKILLAAGENAEARIKSNTAKTKAQGKINVEGMYRTEEDRRKIENRAKATQFALEDLSANPGQNDAQAEIDDDWLNIYARLAEDKSSEELQILFGKILAGEVKRPGSFSLRTLQIMATISKDDAGALSNLLSFAINGRILPFQKDANGKPTDGERVFLEELGVAGHPSQIGAMMLNGTIAPNSQDLFKASHRGVVVENQTREPVEFSIGGQVLNSSAHELTEIANSPPTDIEFLKKVAQQIYSDLRGKHATQMDKRFGPIRSHSIRHNRNRPLLLSATLSLVTHGGPK